MKQQIEKALAGAIYWNTGAFYTDQGQRIGAIEIEGLVLMVDIDRGLSYYYECEFNRSGISYSYINNRNVIVNWAERDPCFHSQVCFALEEATRESAPIIK